MSYTGRSMQDMPFNGNSEKVQRGEGFVWTFKFKVFIKD